MEKHEEQSPHPGMPPPLPRCYSILTVPSSEELPQEIAGDQPVPAEPPSPPPQQIPESSTNPTTPRPTTPHEERPAMLDVHPPHHAVNTWRDFFIHIATIVVGLLIAIGLEQSVEFLHHRHQVHQMEATLHAEDLENQAIVRDDLQVINGVLKSVDAAIAALQAPAPHDPAPTQQPQEIKLFPPVNSSWSAARDSSLLALAPHSLVDNYWKVYFVQDAAVQQMRAVYADLDRIQAFASIHASASPLSASDREELLKSYANYRESLKVLVIDLGYLNQATEMVLRDQTIAMRTLN